MKNLIIVVLISLIVSLIVGKLIALLYKKKKNIINISLMEQEKMQDVSYQLFLADTSDVIRFYSILLGAKRKVETTKDKLAIVWQDYVFVPIYNNLIINADTLAYFYKKFKDIDHIIFAGIKFSDDAIKLCEKIGSNKITLLDEQQTFNIFKKYDFYPDFKIKLNKKEKFKFKKLKDVTFVKNNAKHYFISGIIILVSSFFIKYNIYYLVFATLLFVFAGISFFKPAKSIPSVADEL